VADKQQTADKKRQQAIPTQATHQRAIIIFNLKAVAIGRVNDHLVEQMS
jgi:hypothetical protein